MRASTSRFVYCLGLLAVTACAVLPEALPNLIAPTHAEAAPLTTETRLAQAIRGRVELSTAVKADDPVMMEAVATEAALRDLAFADDVATTRRELIYALTNELSDALDQLKHVAGRTDSGGGHEESDVKVFGSHGNANLEPSGNADNGISRPGLVGVRDKVGRHLCVGMDKYAVAFWPVLVGKVASLFDRGGGAACHVKVD